MNRAQIQPVFQACARSDLRPSLRALGRSGLHLFGVFCALTVLGCAAADGVSPVADAAVPEGTALRFELRAGPLPFGSIPFPDDLYRDANGAIRLDAASLGDGPLIAPMAEDLATLTGFSASSPIYFFADGPIDPESLPIDPEASMLPDATVFLLDIDPSSPSAFTRVPVEWTWLESGRRLAVKPARGEALSSGRKYAVVVTTRVRDAEGLSLRPSASYRVVLEASSVPSDPLAAQAYRAHINAISAVESAGLERSEIAGLATFTVQEVAVGLQRLITQARSFAVAAPSLGSATKGDDLNALLGTPEVGALGVDGAGGVPHENIGWLIQGTFNAPNCLARVSQEVGRFERSADDAWLVKRVEVVPFSLALPMIEPANAAAPVPLIVFQHGLGRDRADMLPLANRLNAAGYAVLAIDAPYHGLRAHGATDSAHRFASTAGSDGLADGDGAASVDAFVGASSAVPAESRLHPGFLRDAVRQNVSDVLVALRTLLETPNSGLVDIAGLPPLTFAPDSIGFVGVDVGAQVGLLLATEDDRIDAGVLVAPAGGLAEWLVQSPALSAFGDDLLTALGTAPNDIDHVQDAPLFWPSLALWQQLADAADPLAFSPSLRRKSRNLLMVTARDDELVNNRTSEALAAALRLPIVSASPARYAPLARASTPLSANVTIAGDLATQALFEHAVASHNLFAQQAGMRSVVSADHAPFVALETPIEIENPIDAALTQAVFFFESWRSGSATVIDPDLQQSIPTD